MMSNRACTAVVFVMLAIASPGVTQAYCAMVYPSRPQLCSFSLIDWVQNSIAHKVAESTDPPVIDDAAREMNRCIIDITSIPNLPLERRSVCNKMIFGTDRIN